jgi:zinc and cadmium transporter
MDGAVSFLVLTGLVFLGSVAGLVGGALFLYRASLARILSRVAIPFSAGVLISVSLIHLIPEAIHQAGEKASYWVLFSFLFSFFFEQVFAHLHHHEEKKGTLTRASIPLVIFGDTVHNLIDGVAIASAYLVSPFSGFVVALSSFLHETPHEIGDFGLLTSLGWERKKTFLTNFFSSLATFPGAYLTFFFSSVWGELTGILLAVSAGTFLYLGASDFLPEVGSDEGKTHWKDLLAFLIGILVIVSLRIFLPDNH